MKHRLRLLSFVITALLLQNTGSAFTGQSEFVVSGSASGIAVFRSDSTTGTLSAVLGSPFATNPSQAIRVTSDPQGRFVYAAHSTGQVSGYSINANTGALTVIAGSPWSAGKNTSQVLVHPSGAFLYASNQDSLDVNGYSIDQATGALTPLPGSPYATGVSGFDIAMDTTGSYAFVASNYGGLAILAVNNQSGALAPVSGSPFPIGSNLASVKVHPNGSYIFLADAVGAKIWALEFVAASSSLTQLPGSPYSSNFPVWIALGPGGQHLYVANWNDAVISGFNIDSATGALAPIAGSPFAAGLVASVVIDQGGNFAYETNDFSADVRSYTVSPQTGALTPTGSPLPVGAYPDSVIVIIGPSIGTGTIAVTTNLQSATFTIAGPATYNGTGTSATFSNAPAGKYTITFGEITGYATPVPQTQTLAAGGTITFTGHYNLLPPPRPITLTSISGWSQPPGIVAARWTGQPPKAPNRGKYVDFYAIDACQNLTPCPGMTNTSNGPQSVSVKEQVQWVFSGSGFCPPIGCPHGNGQIIFSDPNINPVTVPWSHWSASSVTFAPSFADTFNYPGFNKPTVTVITPDGVNSGPLNLPVPSGVISTIAGRGYGQCTWFVANQLLVNGRAIPVNSYNITGPISSTYAPQQFDVLDFGTPNSATQINGVHTAIITSPITSKPVMNPDGSVTTTYSFTISEMNVSPPWNESASSVVSQFVVNSITGVQTEIYSDYCLPQKHRQNPHYCANKSAIGYYRPPPLQ